MPVTRPTLAAASWLRRHGDRTRIAAVPHRPRANTTSVGPAHVPLVYPAYHAVTVVEEGFSSSVIVPLPARISFAIAVPPGALAPPKANSWCASPVPGAPGANAHDPASARSG